MEGGTHGVTTKNSAIWINFELFFRCMALCSGDQESELENTLPNEPHAGSALMSGADPSSRHPTPGSSSDEFCPQEDTDSSSYKGKRRQQGLNSRRPKRGKQQNRRHSLRTTGRHHDRSKGRADDPDGSRNDKRLRIAAEPSIGLGNNRMVRLSQHLKLVGMLTVRTRLERRSRRLIQPLMRTEGSETRCSKPAKNK